MINETNKKKQKKRKKTKKFKVWPATFVVGALSAPTTKVAGHTLNFFVLFIGEVIRKGHNSYFPIYDYSLSSADSTRVVVSFWWKNVHKYWLAA